MPKKSCRKQKKCSRERDRGDCNRCYDKRCCPCNVYYLQDNSCCSPCIPICCPFPVPPPAILTNIAVLGTGPFGPDVSIGFTVVNTTTVPAAGVSVSISADQLGVVPGGISASGGTFINQPGTSFIIWSVGTLLGGQSASITFNQVGVGASPNTWTAIGATSTPEVTVADNTATVFVPFPG